MSTVVAEPDVRSDQVKIFEQSLKDLRFRMGGIAIRDSSKGRVAVFKPDLDVARLRFEELKVANDGNGNKLLSADDTRILSEMLADLGEEYEDLSAGRLDD